MTSVYGYQISHSLSTIRTPTGEGISVTCMEVPILGKILRIWQLMSLFHHATTVEPGIHTWINLKVPGCWTASSDCTSWWFLVWDWERLRVTEESWFVSDFILNKSPYAPNSTWQGYSLQGWCMVATVFLTNTVAHYCAMDLQITNRSELLKTFG